MISSKRLFGGRGFFFRLGSDSPCSFMGAEQGENGDGEVLLLLGEVLHLLLDGGVARVACAHEEHDADDVHEASRIQEQLLQVHRSHDLPLLTVAGSWARSNSVVPLWLPSR